jgi:hypothetical protein
MSADQVQGRPEPKYFTAARKDRKGQPNLTKSKTYDCPESSGPPLGFRPPRPRYIRGFSAHQWRSRWYRRSLRSNRNVWVYAKVAKEDKARAADALAKVYRNS